MKSLQTSLFFAAVLGVLALCGSAWGVESSESIQDLISHWKFDESSGTTAYDSAGNNDGTLHGGGWISGKVGQALLLDGIDDYVSLSSLAVTTTEFTIAAWANMQGVGGGPESVNQIFAQRDDTTGDNSSTISLCSEYAPWSSSSTSIRSSNGTGQSLASSVQNYNEWHHYAITVNSSDFIFYIDGVEVDRTVNNQLGDYVTSIDYIDIGRRRFNRITRGFFNGAIDDVRIYDRALLAEEIQQLYQGVFPELVGLEIVGPNEVAEDFSASYKAVAYYDNDSTRDVTDSALWVIEPNTAANIDENGVLRTKDIVKNRSVTILASYTEGDVIVEAEKAIDILAICPTGTALQFDGVDDYVDFSKNIITTTEFTVSAWANHYGSPGGSSPVNAIFQQRDDASQAGYAQSLILLATEYPGDYAAAIIRSSGGSSTQRLSYPKKNYDEWHQYSMTVDSTDFTFYIDGVEVDRTSNDQAGDYVTSIDYVSIGRHSYRGANRGLFNGVIDEVAIYNRALSAEEIRANMHSKLTADEPNLVGYWDFDEGEGQIVYDLSGNGNDGQLGSTPSPDVSDPAWVESDAPIGICTPYQIATLAADGAVERKLSMLEELLAALAEEWAAYEALEELLESGDYGDLYKGDIVTAKQKIHSATQHEEQSIDALEKSIEKLEDALSALGYEPNTAANIDENGVLRTKDIVTHQSATILASYTEGDVTFDAEKAIDILAICPTGTALQFDGVDDYVQVADSEDFDFTSEFTLCAWVMPARTTTNGRIIYRYDPTSQYGYFLTQAGHIGVWSFDTDLNDKDIQVFSDNAPTSQWTHVLGTRNSDGLNMLYINGILQQDTCVYTDVIDSSGDLFIGVDYLLEKGFHGLIDDVRIYNRALSAEEIQVLMHTRPDTGEPGLVGYWDFDESGGQIVYDLSGNGNDGTLGATPSPDVSDPAWVKSDAPIGICSLYQIATMAAERALERKTAMLEELLASLAKEWAAYEALEELLESGDYGDLNKGDIVTAKQKIHSAIQHQEQAIDALEKSIEKLEDALSALGYEPEDR